MEVEYREIKESKVAPVWSSTPKPLTRPKLVTMPRKPRKSKNEAYAESWKL